MPSNMDDEEMLIPDRVPEQDQNESENDEDVEISNTISNFQRIGITLVVLGLVSMVLGVIAACNSWSSPAESAPGTWCGIFAVATGSLAITLKYHMTQSVLLANLILTIVSSVFCFILFALDVISIFAGDGYASNIVLASCGAVIAIALTTLCIYHSIVTGRMMQKSRGTSLMSVCCYNNSNTGYPGVAMAYVPQVPTPQQQAHGAAAAVYMAVPQGVVPQNMI